MARKSFEFLQVNLPVETSSHKNTHHGFHKILPSICKPVSLETQTSPTSHRRSANYKSSTWHSDLLLESLKFHHVPETEDEKMERLKATVKDMVADQRSEPSSLLKLIDDIQRLGVANHFDKDIRSVLNRLASNIDSLKLDLNDTALIFRLLRQNGIWISQDEFERFKDEEGNFMSSLGKDVKGMLNLYEASYFALEGEQLLDEAKASSRKHISDVCSIEEKFITDYVHDTLENPLRYRIPRLVAKDELDKYSTGVKTFANGNDLLELAKLDFNMVQAMHQVELQELAVWWKDTGLANSLSFARDRLAECFFCSAGAAHKPEFSACRKALTKVYLLVTILDDIYDIHGYMDELELFTNIVERWDISAIDDLPDYMRSTFVTLYNTVNEIGCEIFKEKGQNYLPYLRKSWEDLCKAFLVEAKWYYRGQIPTFNDYLKNGWVTSSMALGLIHAYFYVSPTIIPEALHCLLNNHDILRLPSTIFRLANDLATHEAELERGEAANAISSYAKQYGVSSEDARKHMNKLIDDNWKGLNAIRVDENTKFTQDFMEIALNHARTAQCLYQHGDGYGSPEVMKKRMSSLVIELVHCAVPN